MPRERASGAAHLGAGPHSKGNRMALQVVSNLSIAVYAAAQKEAGRIEGVAGAQDHRRCKPDVGGSLCRADDSQDPGCALPAACLIRIACKNCTTVHRAEMQSSGPHWHNLQAKSMAWMSQMPEAGGES